LIDILKILRRTVGWSDPNGGSVMLHKNGVSPGVSTLFDGMTASGHLCGTRTKRSQEFKVLKYFSRLHFDQKRKLCSSAIKQAAAARQSNPRGVTLKELHHRSPPCADLQIEKLLSRFPGVPLYLGSPAIWSESPATVDWPHCLTFNFHDFSKSILSPSIKTNIKGAVQVVLQSTFEAHPFES
jgi:hypothetical protein